MRRVAITGLGAVSAAGLGADKLWDAARSGQSQIKQIEFSHAQGNRILIGGSVEGFDPREQIDEKTLQTCDRYTQFALFAAREAIDHAGMKLAGLKGDRTAVIIGTGVGGISTLDEGFRYYYSGRKFDTFAVPRAMPSSAASHLGIAYGINGPTFTVTSACASSNQAIGLAAMLVRNGVVDRAIAGGAEACLTPATMRSWEYLRVLTNDLCRPFSVGRSGMVIGEGAGIFLLEAEDALRARDGQALAWVAGYGTSSDACDMIKPSVEGAARAIELALVDAGLPPVAVGYINAHGTGTVVNDVNEALALRQVFGAALDDIPVSSSKPVIGHVLGAAGALELIVAVSALREQVVPPQVNCRAPDPRCSLRLPLDGALDHNFNVALSNSFAFGGINAVLIVASAG